MYRYASYLWMSLAVLLVQIFLLDNIAIHTLLRPMIFPLVVLLLPMEWRSIWVLLTALAVGAVMDLSLGGAGLYVATLLPVAMLRSTIMYLTTNRVVEHGNPTALFTHLSMRQLMIYVSVALLLQLRVLFKKAERIGRVPRCVDDSQPKPIILEALSAAAFWRLFGTILFSTTLSLVIAWPFVQLFTSKVASK